MANELIKVNAGVMELIHSSQIEDKNPFTEEILLTDILVAGIKQEPVTRELISRINPGMELTMKRTEDELYPFYIWLSFEDHVIGQVPVENGVIIARLMDAGKKLKCVVTWATTHTTSTFKKPFSRVLAKIYLVD